MQKITLKITKSEFSEIYNYCEKTKVYSQNLPSSMRNVYSQIVAEIGEQMESNIHKWKYFIDGKEYTYKLRISEAQSLAYQLLNYIPVNQYNTLQNVLSKLDKSLVNANIHLKSIYGTENNILG